MFTVDKKDVAKILVQFGVYGEVSGTEELLRYHYERDNPDSKEVRLILKVSFLDRAPMVVKFKNEDSVTQTMVQEQTAFSEHLASQGVPTARYYRSEEGYVLRRTINGYTILITAEDFQPGEIKTVNPSIAERTGRLLALTHNISERDRRHTGAPVLFDPFDRNDLFSFEIFEAFGPRFQGEDEVLFRRICRAYQEHMERLAPLRGRERYAVQGDISDCNLFLTPDGRVGMFDFNNCGDNILFCDAVMQGVFEARLMDYERTLTEAYSQELFDSFLAGYQSERPFSEEERAMVPHLCAIIAAFARIDLIYRADCLEKRIETGDREGVTAMLREIERRIVR